MELNNIIFPSPKSTNINIQAYCEELIFIPRNKTFSYCSNSIILDNHSNNNEIKKYSSKHISTSGDISDARNEIIKNNMNNNCNSKQKLITTQEMQDFFTNDSTNDYIPALLLLKSNTSFVNKKFMIFFHGNAEDIFHSKEFADKIKEELDVNIISIEYPGYSIYFSDKNSQTILSNALVVYDFLVNEIRINPENILILGRSIGTSPAVYLASKRKCAGLILISAFISVQKVAERILGRFLKFLISERFENYIFIRNVVNPILFIHGQKDDMIPYQHTLSLKNECQSPYEVVLPESMDHNNFDMYEDVIIPIKNFLARYISDNEKYNFYLLNKQFYPQSRPIHASDLIRVPQHYYMVPFCIIKKIKQNREDEENKKSIFFCFGKK